MNSYQRAGVVLRNQRFWLLSIAAGLVFIHLSLSAKCEQSDVFSGGVLVWSAIATLIWQKRQSFRFSFGIFNLVGFALLLGLLLATLRLSVDFLWIFPFVAVLSLSLLAAGNQALPYFWRELLAVFFWGVPKVIVEPLLDISPWTAIATTKMMNWIGIPAMQTGVTVQLPGGSVEVYAGCSGLSGMLYLLSLAVLFLVMISRRGWHNLYLPMLAVLLAFVVNAVRVMLMAILLVTQGRTVMEYWHSGTGSMLFSLAAVVLLGGCCVVLLNRWERPARKITVTPGGGT